MRLSIFYNSCWYGVVLDAMQREQSQYDRERDDSEADEVHYI